MKQLMNVWFPHEAYKALKDIVKNPCIFALIRDGRPTLEMHNPGVSPKEGFNQFMFLELPFIPKPTEEFKSVEKGEKDVRREENTDPRREDPAEGGTVCEDKDLCKSVGSRGQGDAGLQEGD